jgi:hypothetical protein
MRLTTAILFSLSIFAAANPIAEPQPTLEKRDVVCKATKDIICRWGPGSNSFVRRRDVAKDATFGVKCTEKNSAGKYVCPELPSLSI